MGEKEGMVSEQRTAGNSSQRRDHENTIFQCQKYRDKFVGFTVIRRSRCKSTSKLSVGN